jgi:hypothetical protein
MNDISKKLESFSNTFSLIVSQHHIEKGYNGSDIDKLKNNFEKLELEFNSHRKEVENRFSLIINDFSEKLKILGDIKGNLEEINRDNYILRKEVNNIELKERKIVSSCEISQQLPPIIENSELLQSVSINEVELKNKNGSTEEIRFEHTNKRVLEIPNMNKVYKSYCFHVPDQSKVKISKDKLTIEKINGNCFVGIKIDDPIVFVDKYKFSILIERTAKAEIFLGFGDTRYGPFFKETVICFPLKLEQFIIRASMLVMKILTFWT